MKIKLQTILAALLIAIPFRAVLATSSIVPTQTKSFEVSPGGTLEVSIAEGDIVIGSWDKNEVLIKAEGIDPEDVKDLRMDQVGNGVRIDFHPEWGASRRVRFMISVPSTFNSDLHTAGGDITLQGAFKGTLEGSTSGGDIKLGDVDGKCDMSTSGGDINAGKIGGSVSLQTSGGDISIQTSTGEVEVSTSGGDIRVGNVGKSLTAKTAGGDIAIGDVGGEAIISTAGGDIEVGQVSGSATLKTAGGDITLRGAKGIVKAKTAGGDISLEDVSGSVQASTAGGDITAELLPSGTGRSTLSSSGGDLTLYLPANSKANIEAIIDLRGRWKDESEEYEILSDFKAATYEKDEDTKEIRATYVLNGGGESITLETVNGNIEIRELR